MNLTENIPERISPERAMNVKTSEGGICECVHWVSLEKMKNVPACQYFKQ